MKKYLFQSLMTYSSLILLTLNVSAKTAIAPNVNPVPNQIVCNSNSTTVVTFTGSLAGTTFNWTNNTPSIGLAPSGSGNIASFPAINNTASPVTATITVTPVLGSIVGIPITFTITVNPTPFVNGIGNKVVCAGAATGAINITGTVPGAVYNWVNSNAAIGLAANGAGNIASFTATNATNAPITSTITVSPVFGGGGGGSGSIVPTATTTIVLNGNAGCTPMDIAFNPLLNLYYATGGGSSSCGIVTFDNNGNLVFNTSNSGHDWRGIWWNPNLNDLEGNACSGCPANGIRVQNLNGSGYALGTGTTVLPPNQPNFQSMGDYDYVNNEIIYYDNGTIYRVNRTSGVSQSNITITGLPVPLSNLNSYLVGYSGVVGSEFMIYDYVLKRVYFINRANGAYVAASQLPVGTPATSSAWNVGFANGQIWVFNGSGWNGYRVSNPGSGTGCLGPAITFTITVNPSSTVNAIANQTVCNRSTFPGITLGSPVAGTVFNWTSSNTFIGLNASGTGNIPGFTAINTTSTPIIDTITVTPTSTFNGVSCTGTSKTFTITVNPSPDIIITNLPLRVCLTDTIVIMAATPVGGVWAGRGVSGNTFLASAAGLGVSNVSYAGNNNYGCTSTVYTNVTVNDCIERHNVFAQAFRIYPNPGTGQVYMEFLTDKYTSFDMNVIDAGGKIVYNYHFSGLLYGSIIPLNLSSLPSGVYILNVYNTLERANFTIMIEH